MKNPSQINWDNILEKMEKHINKLSPRILSLYGKTILINTLILSKASYLSNVFPVNTEIAHKINNKTFKYLWNNKATEPIARKTIHLKQKLGGLNLIEPEAHNYAMRIKHLLTLNQKENPPSWKNLVTYWLAIDIQNYTKDYKFLMNNSRTKILTGNKPFYYKGIANYIKNQNKNISKMKPQTKLIYLSIIQEGIKQHNIAGEIQWKNHMPNINFEKVWKNTYKSYGQAFIKDLHYRLLLLSEKNKHIHAPMLQIHQPKLRLLRTHGRQLTFIYTMYPNKKHMETLPSDIDKINRTKLDPTTTSIQYKHSKCK